MRFLPRRGVRAAFKLPKDALEFGVVDSLTIENGSDVPCMGNTLYVCEEELDSIAFDVLGDVSRIEAGTRGRLELSHEGAAYRAAVVCSDVRGVPGQGGWRYTFDALERPQILAPARERFGVEGLGAALLLDALERLDEPKGR